MGLNTSQKTIITKQALALGIPKSFALGVIDKESAGIAFWKVKGKDMPAIRIEGHKFWKYLPKDLRIAAQTQGLASPKVGAVKNPTKQEGRYDMLERMVKINEEAAYDSTSIGIGQIMGFNAEAIGYGSAKRMFEDACKGFGQQADQFLTFISENAAALKAAQNYDYDAFTLVYNGKDGIKNGYSADLKKFVESYRDGEDGTASHNYRERIIALGYPSIEAFQTQYNLEPDGKVGRLTQAELIKAEKAATKAINAPVDNAIKAGAGAGTAIVVGTVTNNPEAIQDTIDVVKDVATSAKPIIKPILPFFESLPAIFVTIGCIAAVCIAGYIIYKLYLEKLHITITQKE